MSGLALSEGTTQRAGSHFGWALGLVAVVSLAGSACSFDDSELAEKPECVRTDDCLAGEICISGRCAANVGCIRNEDCPTGRICVNASCVEPEPTPDLSELDVSDDAPEIVEDIPTDPAEDPVEEVIEDPPSDAPDADDGPQDLSDPDPGDVVADPGDDLDVSDEEVSEVLIVETFDDLPETAEEGAEAFVTELDEEFRYSTDLERWIFAWFYEMSPVVAIRMTGSALPVSEPIPWQQRAAEGGTIGVHEGSVRFVTDGANDERAWAFLDLDEPDPTTSHYFSGTMWLDESFGAGIFRHSVDIRNIPQTVVVNLEAGSDGVRVVGGGDVSLGTVHRTEQARTPRQIDLFWFAGDRVELYVDHRLVQDVSVGDLAASGLARYQVGDNSTGGGGIMRVRDTVFGTFGP